MKKDFMKRDQSSQNDFSKKKKVWKVKYTRGKSMSGTSQHPSYSKNIKILHEIKLAFFIQHLINSGSSLLKCTHP